MEQFSNITITMSGVLSVLFALVAVMIIVVLYHLLFIVVDLRKIMRRFEETTAQIESMLLKPLSIIDEAFSWVIEHINGRKKNKKKNKDEKPFDVEAV
jgi:cell shape-determining protein MreC